MSERGLCVQPAGGRAVVGREDRRASLPATRASGGVARLGAPPLLGEADQHVAPPAPSRHEVSLTSGTQADPLGSKGGGAGETPPVRRSTRTLRFSSEVRTIARSDREHRGPSQANSVRRPHGEGAGELVVDTGVGVLRRDLGRRLASRVSKATLLDRGLPERNALRSRRQRSMMLG